MTSDGVITYLVAPVSWAEPGAGKRVAIFEDTLERQAPSGERLTLRRVLRLSERTIDRHGQRLLVPAYEVHGYLHDMRELWRRIVFTVLISNTDDHWGASGTMPNSRTPRGISVTLHNTLQIAFTWRGRHYRERLPLPPTEKNLAYAAQKRTTIRYEIERGTFDFAEHFPYSPRAREALLTAGGAVRLCAALIARLARNSDPARSSPPVPALAAGTG